MGVHINSILQNFVIFSHAIRTHQTTLISKMNLVSGSLTHYSSTIESNCATHINQNTRMQDSGTMSGPNNGLLKERLDEVVELGLSQAQAYVYIVLLSLGPSVARTISRVSRLGREDTYRALRFLKSLGMVEVIMDKPYTFAAVEPNVAVRILTSQLDNKFAVLRDKAVKVGEWLEGLDRVKTTNDVPPDKMVFRLEGGSQIFERMSKLILSCRFELVRITSSTGISQNYVLGVFEQEKQIAENGVKIRAITEEKSSNRDILTEYSQFVDLRFLEGLRYITKIYYRR